MHLDILVGNLEQGTDSLQGCYLRRRIQHTKNGTYSHASSGVRTQDPSALAVPDNTRHWNRLHFPYALLSNGYQGLFTLG
jgi:hypothetical protein